jgi:hypothetical protein
VVEVGCELLDMAQAQATAMLRASLRWQAFIVDHRAVEKSLILAKHSSYPQEEKLYHFDRLIMSTASKVTLATTILSTVGIIAFVHRSQKVDQAVCIRPACCDGQLI